MGSPLEVHSQDSLNLQSKISLNFEGQGHLLGHQVGLLSHEIDHSTLISTSTPKNVVVASRVLRVFLLFLLGMATAGTGVAVYYSILRIKQMMESKHQKDSFNQMKQLLDPNKDIKSTLTFCPPCENQQHPEKVRNYLNYFKTNFFPFLELQLQDQMEKTQETQEAYYTIESYQLSHEKEHMMGLPKKFEVNLGCQMKEAPQDTATFTRDLARNGFIAFGSKIPAPNPNSQESLNQAKASIQQSLRTHLPASLRTGDSYEKIWMMVQSYAHQISLSYTSNWLSAVCGLKLDSNMVFGEGKTETDLRFSLEKTSNPNEFLIQGYRRLQGDLDIQTRLCPASHEISLANLYDQAENQAQLLKGTFTQTISLKVTLTDSKIHDETKNQVNLTEPQITVDQCQLSWELD